MRPKSCTKQNGCWNCRFKGHTSYEAKTTFMFDYVNVPLDICIKDEPEEVPQIINVDEFDVQSRYIEPTSICDEWKGRPTIGSREDKEMK